MVFIPEFVESQHPRAGKGSPTGGQFVAKGGAEPLPKQRVPLQQQATLQHAGKQHRHGKGALAVDDGIAGLSESETDALSNYRTLTAGHS